MTPLTAEKNREVAWAGYGLLVEPQFVFVRFRDVRMASVEGKPGMRFSAMVRRINLN